MGIHEIIRACFNHVASTLPLTKSSIYSISEIVATSTTNVISDKMMLICATHIIAQC